MHATTSWFMHLMYVALRLACTSSSLHIIQHAAYLARVTFGVGSLHILVSSKVTFQNPCISVTCVPLSQCALMC